MVYTSVIHQWNCEFVKSAITGPYFEIRWLYQNYIKMLPWKPGHFFGIFQKNSDNTIYMESSVKILKYLSVIALIRSFPVNSCDLIFYIIYGVMGGMFIKSLHFSAFWGHFAWLPWQPDDALHWKCVIWCSFKPYFHIFTKYDMWI